MNRQYTGENPVVAFFGPVLQRSGDEVFTLAIGVRLSAGSFIVYAFLLPTELNADDNIRLISS